MMVYSGMTMKRMGMLLDNVGKMKALTGKIGDSDTDC